jgi:CheY-like chemotaxis protein
MHDFNTIYLVDDDYIYLSFTSKILINLFSEAKVRTFISAEEALKNLEREKPDVIFLDINMPGMDAWEFLNCLKGRKVEFDIYVVSSSIDPHDVERANREPLVKQFLEKPLGKNQLERVFFSKA